MSISKGLEFEVWGSGFRVLRALQLEDFDPGSRSLVRIHGREPRAMRGVAANMLSECATLPRKKIPHFLGRWKPCEVWTVFRIFVGLLGVHENPSEFRVRASLFFAMAVRTNSARALAPSLNRASLRIRKLLAGSRMGLGFRDLRSFLLNRPAG